MPDETRLAPRRAPTLDPAVGAPRFLTPWDRLRRWVRGLRSDDTMSDEEVAAIGARHVRIGTTAAGVTMVASGALMLAATPERPLTVVASLATWLVVLAAMRHGSRVARWLGMIQAATTIFGSASLTVLSLTGLFPERFAGRVPLLSALMLVTAGALAFATMTLPATTWFQQVRLERERRKGRARSLEEWRRE